MALLERQVNKVVVGPKELAAGLAQHARLLREALNQALPEEAENGVLHTQWGRFQNEIPDLSASQFADLYAQLLVYNYFAAQILKLETKFSWQTELFNFGESSCSQLDDRSEKVIAELIEWLDKVEFDPEKIASSHHSGWLIRFYEDFLAVYDPQVRQSRGVYYTPAPVVSYIVQSLDFLLRRDFGLEAGLADRVQILDPAAGSGIFLSGVISQIQTSFENHRDMWPEYVSGQLLPRLSGFELLPVPYALSQLLLSMQLAESGYVFQKGERLNIRLGNALEEENTQIKAGEPLVVLGNPPYSGVSANMASHSALSVAEYKFVDGLPLKERKHWLQDDYVKFIRFGQQAIEQAGSGILAFVSNHSYLDNPTFRGMRQSLSRTFDEIYLFDLHGNAKKQERSPDGAPDENVFEIQQGVAIGIFVKKPDQNKAAATVYHADLWGGRNRKYEWLQAHNLAATDWETLKPQSPYYLFVPQNNQYLEEYASGWSITELMPLNTTGVLTARDGFVIDFEDEPLKRRIATFLDPNLDDTQVRQQLGLNENYAWRVGEARRQLRTVKDWENRITDIEYRPFDTRRILYERSVVWRVRDKVMRHMQWPNIGLVCARQQSLPGEWSLVGMATRMIESAYISNKTAEINYLFPLYLYPADKVERVANLNPKFIAEQVKQLKLAYIPEGKGDLITSFGPEDIFHYIYAVLHAPSYRQRYAEFLRLDFPRLPLTSNAALFRELCGYGVQLADLHTGKYSGPVMATFPADGSNRVETVKYDEQGKVWINKTQYFEGINPAVWRFKMGSYQVCQKWLKDRKGHTLSADDLHQYQKIVAALSRTISLMAEIDNVIAQHGGWPLS